MAHTFNNGTAQNNFIMIDQKLIYQICHIAIEAAKAINTVDRHTSKINTALKKDGSQVTAADLLANELIIKALKALDIESYPIITEESDLADTVNLSDFERCWLVDPLDGTKGYVLGHPNFTVNIALIDDGYPILGVIVHPLTMECFWALAGEGAYLFTPQNPKQVINREAHQPPPWRVITGRFQNISIWQQRLAKLGMTQWTPMNSSYKFCVLAKNEADVYPRGAQISAWDTAAGQCILEQAGGAVIDFNGDRLCYTGRAKSHKEHPRPGFIALADKTYVPLYKELLQSEGVTSHDKSR